VENQKQACPFEALLAPLIPFLAGIEHDASV
jgi:hypothetical protein